MVVGDIRTEFNDHTFAPGAFAGKLPTFFQLASLADAAIDQRVQLDRGGGWRGSICPLLSFYSEDGDLTVYFTV